MTRRTGGGCASCAPSFPPSALDWGARRATCGSREYIGEGGLNDATISVQGTEKSCSCQGMTLWYMHINRINRTKR